MVNFKEVFFALNNPKRIEVPGVKKNCSTFFIQLLICILYHHSYAGFFSPTVASQLILCLDGGRCRDRSFSSITNILRCSSIIKKKYLGALQTFDWHRNCWSAIKFVLCKAVYIIWIPRCSSKIPNWMLLLVFHFW